MSYDRYSKFRHNGRVATVPFIEIPKRSTDYYETYKVGKTRFDKLSYQYYNDCDYAWLILQANPELGSIEYNIPDNSTIRIPYPLDVVLNGYIDDIDYYNKYY